MTVAAAAPEPTIEPVDTVELREKLGDLLEQRMSDAVVESVWDIFNRIEKELHSLQAQIDDGEQALNAMQEESDADTEEAINKFLDVVERPVGTQIFTVPPGSETNRAILGLYDAVGRNL